MIKIALCDDEKKFLKLEMKYIEEYFTEKGMPYCVECFSSGEQLLEDKVQIETADLIILDVEMKGIDGISVAKSIRQQNDKVNIAFLSAHMNYSTDGYHVRAVRFILKTLDDLKDYLFECLDCVMTNMDLFDKEITMDFSIGKRTLKIKDIVYLKTSGNYTAFVLSNDSKENLIMRNTLKRLTETMKPFDFIAVSSNETVNLRYITDVTRYLVTLDNGEQIQASQKKYNDVFRAYTLYRGRNA